MNMKNEFNTYVLVHDWHLPSTIEHLFPVEWIIMSCIWFCTNAIWFLVWLELALHMLCVGVCVYVDGCMFEACRHYSCVMQHIIIDQNAHDTCKYQSYRQKVVRNLEAQLIKLRGASRAFHDACLFKNSLATSLFIWSQGF